MNDDLPKLSPFSPAGFDADGPTRCRLALGAQGALRRWVEQRGVEATIDELNRHGHVLRHWRTKDGWVTYRGDLPGGERYLQVAVEDATGDVLVLSIITEAEWERRAAEERAQMTSDQRETADLEERFYERGGALSAEAYSNWENLPVTGRALMSVYVFLAETSNGGFAQYYINTGGEQAEALAGYLRTIGAPETATVVERSIQLVGPPFSEKLTERQWEALDRHAESFQELDDHCRRIPESLPRLAITWVDATEAGGEEQSPG